MVIQTIFKYEEQFSRLSFALRAADSDLQVMESERCPA